MQSLATFASKLDKSRASPHARVPEFVTSGNGMVKSESLHVGGGIAALSPCFVFIGQHGRAGFDFLALPTRDPNDIGTADLQVVIRAELKQLLQVDAGHLISLTGVRCKPGSQTSKTRARLDSCASCQQFVEPTNDY